MIFLTIRSVRVLRPGSWSILAIILRSAAHLSFKSLSSPWPCHSQCYGLWQSCLTGWCLDHRGPVVFPNGSQVPCTDNRANETPSPSWSITFDCSRCEHLRRRRDRGPARPVWLRPITVFSTFSTSRLFWPDFCLFVWRLLPLCDETRHKSESSPTITPSIDKLKKTRIYI